METYLLDLRRRGLLDWGLLLGGFRLIGRLPRLVRGCLGVLGLCVSAFAAVLCLRLGAQLLDLLLGRLLRVELGDERDVGGVLLVRKERDEVGGEGAVVRGVLSVPLRRPRAEILA